jgi:hypothetical protein
MTTSRARWYALFYATAAGLMLLLGCRVTPKKSFTYASSFDTEFDIAAGDTYQLGAYYFGEPFEILPGTMGAKFSTLVPKAQIGTVPQSLELDMVWLDPTLTTVHQTYSMTAPLKMRPHGSSDYNVSYSFKPTDFSGWQLGLHDYLRLDLKPVGGTLGTGWHVKTAYSYHAGPEPNGQAPVITWFNPQSGTVGSTFDIDGMHLGGTNAEVKLNGTMVPVNLGDDLSISCTVPQGATTGKISVKTSFGTATTTNDFTVN